MSKAQEPIKEFLEPNEFLPFIEEQTFLLHEEQQRKANLPNKYSDRYRETTLQELELDAKIYILYQFKKGRNTTMKAYFQAKVIDTNADETTLHFMDARKFSECEEEMTATLKQSATHHSIYLLPKCAQKKPPPPPSPAKNNLNNDFSKVEKAISQMSNDITALKKTVTDQAAAFAKSLKTNNNNIANLKTSNKVIAQQLRPLQHLPPGPAKPKPYDEANPEMEVIVSGLTYGKNENLDEKIKNIGKDKKVILGTTDFVAFRALRRKNPEAAPKDTQPNVILTFKRAADKKAFLASKVDNEYVNITNNDDSKIYINENLTTEQRHLFYLARRFKADHQHAYKYVWTDNGVIKLRKDAGFGEPFPRVIIISNEQDLQTLQPDNYNN